MKKIYTILFVLFFIGTAFGQDEFKPSFQMGMHYGTNYGNVGFKPSIFSSSVQMQDFGFLFIYENVPNLGVQIEANFSQKGWLTDTDTTIMHTRKMNYLEFPLLTHITAGRKYFRFHVNLGPYIAFYRDSFEKFELANPIADSVKSIVYQSFKYQEQYGNKPKSNFDYGFMGGFAFGFYSKFGELTLRLRYSQGLSNLFPQYPKGEYRFSQVQSMYAGISYAVVIQRKQNTK